MKHCKKCDITKSLEEFGNKRTEKSGKQLWCKNCTSEYYNTWRIKNKKKSSSVERKSFTKFYSTTHGRAVHMFNNIHNRAKRNSIEITLTIDWVEEKLNKGICEITDIPFVIKGNNGKGHRDNSFSPSIDRIDQTGPYSPENCQMTCWIYNRAKGAFPIQDLITMMEAICNKSSYQFTG